MWDVGWGMGLGTAERVGKVKLEVPRMLRNPIRHLI